MDNALLDQVRSGLGWDLSRFVDACVLNDRPRLPSLRGRPHHRLHGYHPRRAVRRASQRDDQTPACRGARSCWVHLHWRVRAHLVGPRPTLMRPSAGLRRCAPVPCRPLRSHPCRTAPAVLESEVAGAAEEVRVPQHPGVPVPRLARSLAHPIRIQQSLCSRLPASLLQIGAWDDHHSSPFSSSSVPNGGSGGEGSGDGGSGCGESAGGGDPGSEPGSGVGGFSSLVISITRSSTSRDSSMLSVSNLISCCSDSPDGASTAASDGGAEGAWDSGPSAEVSPSPFSVSGVSITRGRRLRARRRARSSRFRTAARPHPLLEDPVWVSRSPQSKSNLPQPECKCLGGYS